MPFKTFPKLKPNPKKQPTVQAPPLDAVTSETKRLGAFVATIDHAADELDVEPRSDAMTQALDEHCYQHRLTWDQYDETSLIFQSDATAKAAS